MRAYLLLLSFDYSFLLGLDFRLAYLPLSFTISKLSKDVVTDPEVLPVRFRFLEDVIWLEILNLSQR